MESGGENIRMSELTPLVGSDVPSAGSIAGPSIDDLLSRLDRLYQQTQQQQPQQQQAGGSGDEVSAADLDNELANSIKQLSSEQLESHVLKNEDLPQKLLSLQLEKSVLAAFERLTNEDDLKEDEVYPFVEHLGEKMVQHIFLMPAASSLTGRIIRKKWEKVAAFVFDSMIDYNWANDRCTVYYNVLEAPFDGENGRTVFQELTTRAHRNLVDHDLMRLLTYKKWQQMKRKRWLIGLPYLFTLFCLTFTLVTSVSAEDVHRYNSPLQVARLVFEVLSVGMVVMKLTIELFQFYSSRFHYFSDPLNLMELLACIIILCVTLPMRYAAVGCHWYPFAIGYTFWVLLAYKYAAFLRPLYFQAQIFIQVLKRDIPYFMVLFLFINLAFAGSLYLVIRGDEELVSALETSTFGHIFAMGIRTLAEGQPVVDYYGEYGALSTILIVVFLFIVVVILLNMLIAQLGETLANVNKTMCRNYHINLAATMAWMELNQSFCVARGFCVATIQKVTSEEIEDKDRKKILQPRESVLEKIHKNVENLVENQTEVPNKLQEIKQDVLDTRRLIPEFATKMDGTKKQLQKLRKDLEYLSTFPETVEMELKKMTEMVKEACRGIVPNKESSDTDDSLPKPDDLTARPAVMENRRLEIVGQDETDQPLATIDHQRWRHCLDTSPPEVIMGEIESYILDGQNPAIVMFPDTATPLCIVVEKGYYHVARKLLELYGNDQAYNSDKQKALQIALAKPFDHIAALLVQNMNDKDPEWFKSLFVSQNDQEKAVFKLADYFKKDYKHFVTAVLDSLEQGNNVDLTVFNNNRNGFPPDKTGETTFQLLADSGETEFFSHRVVQFLIWKKWTEKGGNQLFLIFMVVYLVSLACLTVACVLAVQSKDVKKYTESADYARILFEVISMIFVVLTLIIKIYEICKVKSKGLSWYVRDLINFAELGSSAILSFLFPVRFLDAKFHWYWLALGYFLWVLIIFRYAAVHRGFGTYAQSLYLIITRDMVQFSCLFVVILLAFSGTFLLVLKGDNALGVHNETSNFLEIMFTGIRAMTDGQNSVDYYGESGYGNPMSIIVMVVFLFVTIVILLNILIAQLSNTYSDNLEEASAAFWARRARTLASFETSWKYCSRLYKGRTLNNVESTEGFQVHTPAQISLTDSVNSGVECLLKMMPAIDVNVLGMRAETQRSKRILMKMDTSVEMHSMLTEIGEMRKKLETKCEELHEKVDEESKTLKELIKTLHK